MYDNHINRSYVLNKQKDPIMAILVTFTLYILVRFMYSILVSTNVIFTQFLLVIEHYA
jgi:hypothetical protein